MSTLKGIILAAGRGTRMRNYNQPKSTLKLTKNLTIMDKLLSNFRKNNINNLSLVTGFKFKAFEKYKVKKIKNKNWKQTNMFKSLLCADKILNNSPCVISYADIVYDQSAIHQIKKTKNDIAISYYTEWLTLWKKRFKNPLLDAEVFKLDKKKIYLKKIGTKPKSIKEIEGQYMGLLYIKPRGWKKIKKIFKNVKSKKFDKISMTEVLNISIKNGLKVEAIKYKNFFAEMDSPKDYKILKNYLKKK